MHCSNIAMQRTVDDHTTYMVRARTKCKIGQDATSTDLPATSCDNLDSYTRPKRWGLQRTDRVVATCRLPLNRGVGNVFTYSYVPGHLARLHRNYPHPPGTPTLWIDKHRTWSHPKAQSTANSTLL